MNNQIIQIRLPANLKEKLKKRASDEGLSMAGLIRQLINKELEQKRSK